MNDRALREHLANLLEGKGAHLDLRSAVTGFPESLADSRLEGLAHSPWRLLEHMRIAQWDILEFCRNPEHVSPRFPDGYWPEGDSTTTQNGWRRTVESFLRDLETMQAYVLDGGTDLFMPLPHGEGQTVLREALLVADHNAYHLGQLLLLRKALG